MIRRLCADDLVAFQSYRSDPELARFQGWSATSDEAALVFLNDMHAMTLFETGKWSQLGIVDDERLVGDIGVYVDDQQRYAELGFTLSQTVQGRGIATRAVKEAIDMIWSCTDVDRIQSLTDVRNSRAIRLLDRVGMTLVGQSAADYKGESCIELSYTLSRS